MKGPNDNLSSPDFSVGSMMKFDVKAATTIISTKDYRFSDRSGNPKTVKVCLEKGGTNRWIIHGITTNTGLIRLFNVEPGDKILAATLDGNKWRYISRLFMFIWSISRKWQTIHLSTLGGMFTSLSARAPTLRTP